jgi:hypothetical protein
MKHLFLSGALVALCLWTGPGLISAARADDPRSKKESKDDAKDKASDKDKKPDGVKRSQTTTVGQVTAKITKVDDTTMSLEVYARRGNRKVDDILIASDVKVRLPAEPEFDEKGKPKPSRPDPNDPDRKLGGVKGSHDDLREGQRVVVSLGKFRKKLVANVIVVLPEKK